MSQLAGVFALDLCAYAVMSNHYHVVLHVDRVKAEAWDDAEVIRRWRELFSGHSLVQRYVGGEGVSNAELMVAQEIVAEWRARLMDISLERVHRAPGEQRGPVYGPLLRRTPNLRNCRGLLA